MRRIGLPALGLALGLAGCGETPTPPPRSVPPLAIRQADTSPRVFSGSDETPGLAHTFVGAPGTVRVTMEVDGASASEAGQASPSSLNDVLFKAEGDGRIVVEFKRPSPGHPEGRVTIRCLSGGEESSAVFEPTLWYHLSGAIVTFEPPAADFGPVAPGKEVVLGRYVARNVPRDVRLTFKAVFSKDPVAPRTQVGVRPNR